MNKESHSETDPRTGGDDVADGPREGQQKDDVPTRDIVDDWLWEHYGFGLRKLAEEFGDRAPTDPPLEKYPSETVEAVAPNEVTAGVHVRRVDVDEEIEDMPFMVELEQYFPPGDDREGDTVAIHGEHAVFQTIAALATVTGDRFEEVPWDDA